MKNPDEYQITDNYSAEAVVRPETADSDWVFRIADGQILRVVKTQVFQDAVTDVATTMVCAHRALGNLWHEYTYLREYCSFVGGLHTKEEFATIAARFAREYDNLTEEEIELFASLVSKSIGHELSADDLSKIANTDPTRIDPVIAYLSAKNIEAD